jgi:hypothetical protein
MFNRHFFCTCYRRYPLTIQRFALLAPIALFCFCLGLHGQTTRDEAANSSLLGQVTQSGLPVPSATVKAYEEVIKGGQLRLEMKCASRTNEAGQYSCRGLTAGRYYLFVQIQDRSSASSTKHSGAAPAFAFYYQASDLADAESVSVREAQTQIVQIEMGRHPVFTVSGRLSKLPKAPSLSLQSLGSGTESMPTGLIPSYDPASGAFSFRGVPPGQYSLGVLWHDAEGEHSSEVAATVINQDVVDLQVHDAGGVHLVLELQPCGPGSAAITQLNLDIVDGHLIGGTKVALVSPGTRNRFDFKDLPGGEYFVGLVGGKSAYIEGSSLAPQGFSGNLISVPDGGGSITAEVQMGCEASSLAGRVDTEDGVDMQAYVILRSSLTGETFQRNADGNGNFTFSGIAPGEYKVYAVPALGWYNHPSNSLFDDAMGSAVTLGPNGTTKIVVPLAQ